MPACRMRIKRPVVAATALGIAGAVLPTSPALAGEAHLQTGERVTVRGTDGASHECRILVAFDHYLGSEGSYDDEISGSTGVGADVTGSGEDEFFCEAAEVSVALRWHATHSNSADNRTYLVEGWGNVYAWHGDAPALGYENANSEHRVHFPNCTANCDRVYRFAPK